MNAPQAILKRCCSVWLPLMGFALGSMVDHAVAEALDPRVQAYFQSLCLRCHGKDSTESEFRIDNLSPKVGIENTPQPVAGEHGADQLRGDAG